MSAANGIWCKHSLNGNIQWLFGISLSNTVHFQLELKLHNHVCFPTLSVSICVKKCTWYLISSQEWEIWIDLTSVEHKHVLMINWTIIRTQQQQQKQWVSTMCLRLWGPFTLVRFGDRRIRTTPPRLWLSGWVEAIPNYQRGGGGHPRRLPAWKSDQIVPHVAVDGLIVLNTLSTKE